MSDGPSGADHRKPLLERLAALLLRVPEDREQLLDLLRQAHERALLDAEAMSMIEGVLQVSELTARDVMVPRAEMDVLDISQPPAVFLPKVIATGHSRYPVVEGDRDNVVGILHAKSLLRLCASDPVDVHELLRPALFVPESQRLNLLLRDLRAQRAQVAIVVDEYGGTAGLVTLEEVMQRIVGDLDEDLDDAQDDDIVRVEPAPNGALRHRVRAGAKIDTFNEAMGTRLPQGSYETIGELVGDRLGRPPRRGERIDIDGVRFEVVRADAAQALLLRTEQLPGAARSGGPAVAYSSPLAAMPPSDAAGSPAGAPALPFDSAGAERLASGSSVMNAHGATMRSARSRAGTTVAHGG
ncbi:MAG TPA: transporter associated domain-containing protein [Zeimonas sp.]